MIYTPLTVKAMRIAYDAHQGQVDKSGTPYIFHPAHLAEQMPDEFTTCVALLHDVVEDTPLTFEDLSRDFPSEVINALRKLTHAANSDYFEYVRTLRDDPIAATVKRADLMHNSDETRFVLAPIDAATQERLRKKYQKALAILNGEE